MLSNANGFLFNFICIFNRPYANFLMFISMGRVNLLPTLRCDIHLPARFILMLSRTSIRFLLAIHSKANRSRKYTPINFTEMLSNSLFLGQWRYITLILTLRGANIIN
ncbi:hypothetical protein yruck0001_14830 [Yersinia ruckeri ATCC 29473]|uniref:Uncharacterized protein n=1 Tax=Yersinia ruckeri TaxID=29486 RepID=A0A0A8VD06_YERRU|nr:hypothetical protein yruck0001_14830 [Yersinia ruckeri ATCC 29473]CEK27455.1 hypothetical protein CSF007_8510 [Yersinia ruckeri]